MQERDLLITEFIENNPCRSTTIAKVFNMPIRIVNRRLKALTEYGYINRYRENVNNAYFYYASSNRPKQIHHMDLVALSYVYIRQMGYEILSFRREVALNGIRPDALVLVSKDNRQHYICVEVERNNNRLPKKINKYHMQQQLKEYEILYVCNKPVKDKLIKITTIRPMDLLNI